MKNKFIQDQNKLGQWILKKDKGAKVIFFASEKILNQLEEEVIIQATNVSQLPGLIEPVCIMPDAHSGYGAPIGTVFAMKEKEGYVVPGAVGYDINCGMRLILTNLRKEQVIPKIKTLVNELYQAIPVGVGRRGFLSINKNELKKIVEEGVVYLIKEKGFGWQEDLEKIEEKGKISNADLSTVSNQAIERGINQLATLGSGNHYLEIQLVEKIFDRETANVWGIESEDQVVIMIHCGSRGLGHQVCSDYLKIFNKKVDDINIKLNDRQLACLPISYSLAKNYLQAMAAAANFAFANRQLITYQLRRVFEKIFAKKAEDLGLKIVYDVCHNIAKFEEFAGRRLLIHRKGATRSYPEQPVIIGGSMETGSYLLKGTREALRLSYGSTAHGSGRTMSRAKAKKVVRGEKLWQDLANRGIYIKSASWSGLAEEAGLAYKNITDIVESVSLAGLSSPVCSFKPIGNIKG